jgi:hypothetical protein
MLEASGIIMTDFIPQSWHPIVDGDDLNFMSNGFTTIPCKSVSFSEKTSYDRAFLHTMYDEVTSDGEEPYSLCPHQV